MNRKTKLSIFVPIGLFVLFSVGVGLVNRVFAVPFKHLELWCSDVDGAAAIETPRFSVSFEGRSFGNRSDRGAEAHGTIMSLIQTLQLQGKSVGESLRMAFLRHRQGFTAPCLSIATR